MTNSPDLVPLVEEIEELIKDVKGEQPGMVQFALVAVALVRARKQGRYEIELFAKYLHRFADYAASWEYEEH